MSRPPRLNSVTLLLGIGAATAAAHMGNNFTTYLIGGLMDRYGFQPLQMGLFSLTEMLSYAIAMFLISPRTRRLSPRALMALAGLLVAAAQLASAAFSQLAFLLAGRLATGVGFGLANTALNLAAGRTPAPTRAISTGIGIQTVLYALINIGLPLAGERWGVGGMFVSLAGLTALFTLAAVWLPAGASTAEDGKSDGAYRPGISHERVGPDGSRVLAAMALFTFGSLAIWPFIERAAHAIAIPAAEFGRFQSVATLVSALSSLALAAVVARLPVRAPLIFAVLVCGASCAVLTTASTAPPFALALVTFNASWFVSYSLLLGVSYSVDASGRLAVLCSGVWLLMMSLGSLATGAIAQWAGSYRVIGPAGFAVCVAALSLVAPLAKRIDARSGGHSHRVGCER
jgi:predicted MFS family arabinose efflux permease